MNPNLGGEKPQSSQEAPAFSSEHLSDESKNQEKSPLSPESQPAGQPSTSVIVVPVSTPVTIPDDQSLVATPSTPTTDSTPSKGVDRIEKIWVDRAKAIISQTKDDPFVQKNEVSKVKAEYIRKHFNKDVKLDDAVA